MLDAAKLQISESIFLNHKTATAIDSTSEYVLAGMEDGIVKVFDLRQQATKAQSVIVYECHQKWVSQVKCHPQSENVFLTAGYDGKVKMWDLRNQKDALSTLKRQAATDKDKVFATCWNGSDQILSGGTDSHISVHELA